MAHNRKTFLAVLLSLAASAAPSVFAQIRVAPGETSVPGLRPSLGASAAPSATVAPALTVSPLIAPSAVSISAPLIAPAPLAAAVMPAAPAPAPAFAAARGAVAAPSDGPSAPKSGESAKAAADKIFDAAKAASAAEPDAVAGRETAPAPALKPAAAQPAASLFDPGPRTASLPDQVRDQMRYNKLLSRSFWWYMYTHIGDMWPGYKARVEKARAEGPVAVSRTRSFFTSMRVTGMSGRFYALGGSALDDDLVIAEFRESFVRYFDGPGVGALEREALERFMARAKTFNAEKRAHTNMYKNIRDPLLKASTMRPDRLAAYFDSLLPPEKENAIKDFQTSGRMDATREAFLAVLRETLDEEDASDPHRVRAAIVLGSFASGSAGPGSDFDVEALVNGASNARLPAFMKRLTERWAAAGYHATNPVTVHDNASWPSWGLVNIIQTRHYIVVSPEPSLVARLSRQAFENPATVLERGYTLRGRVNRAAQRAIVVTATYVSDAKAALGIQPSSGH